MLEKDKNYSEMFNCAEFHQNNWPLTLPIKGQGANSA